MHRTQGYCSRAKFFQRKKGFMSSVKGVSHLSRRAKRRWYFKLQLWMWRKRREKYHFGIFRNKKRMCKTSSGSDSCLNLKEQSQKNKRKVHTHPTTSSGNLQARTTAVVSSFGCDAEVSKATFRGQDCLQRPRESVSLSETVIAPGSLHKQVINTNIAAAPAMQSALSQRTETSRKFCENAESSKCSCTVKPALSAEGSVANCRICPFKAQRTMISPQTSGVDCPAGQLLPVAPGQGPAPVRDTDPRLKSKKSYQADVNLKTLTKDIHEFLDGFYRIYGSFIPLQQSDVLRHLKRTFNSDFSDRKNVIFSEVDKYRTTFVQKPVPSFQVVYKKHTLTLDDLLTLADQNWLNDQIMNMYGELIVESSSHKVHFLNSFFHRQLMTKGYDGVKRWTKQVDLFSKSLLLVPIHLEVHWCLVTADLVKKKICLYDSQGNALQKVARNILKYLMTEAKEKQHTDFENGWAVSFDEKIPQQSNENDCGVFVLEYCRCLALAKPFQFSQEDIPKIRKRIYKELCDCKLHEES
ncbi:sentrin-specific protease 5-like [Echeneis naucrates]|uniref:sentrin-specific protease 5-like n=1 Tax=Echeneis naucrates TaxID=173247 RepID=UPI0011141E04|nr:sentrin-specific protease 5-like [Echeneis naucrates]XP_029380960.1 sentrin-specific protease 5-like [Echeneis naucrates]XP_029380961.1 sentrin-specific protease 5-like [Echeneis naucrates]